MLTHEISQIQMLQAMADSEERIARSRDRERQYQMLGRAGRIARERLVESQPAAFTAAGAHWIPDELIGMAALVLDGKGAGQYRIILSNGVDRATLDRPDLVASGTIEEQILRLVLAYVVPSRLARASAEGQYGGKAPGA